MARPRGLEVWVCGRTGLLRLGLLYLTLASLLVYASTDARGHARPPD